jgi:hypothetical protein
VTSETAILLLLLGFIFVPTPVCIYGFSALTLSRSPQTIAAMQRYLLPALTLAIMVGCGKKDGNQLNEAFGRFATNFHLRLQRQYFEPRTAPIDVVIKLSDIPQASIEGDHGTITFTQSETTREIERDVRVTLTFIRQDKRWELAKGEAVVVTQAKRGKLKQPVEGAEPTDALADEVYGPRIQAALADTPQF